MNNFTEAASRFWSHVAQRTPEECWLWRSRTGPAGYGKFRIRRIEYGAHRVAYSLAHGNIPAGLVVMHMCNTPACVNPDHLKIGTQADNNAYRAACGRSNSPVGEAHWHAKLDLLDVRRIRRLCRKGTPHKVLADDYGVTKAHISHIARGSRWPVTTDKNKNNDLTASHSNDRGNAVANPSK